MLHDLKTNNGQTQPSIAEQRAAEFRAPSLPSRPTAARSATGRANWRAWLLAGALGLLVGVAGTLATVDQWAPLAGAQRIRSAEVTVVNDDSRWFLIGGWAMRLPDPKAPASVEPGQ